MTREENQLVREISSILPVLPKAAKLMITNYLIRKTLYSEKQSHREATKR